MVVMSADNLDMMMVHCLVDNLALHTADGMVEWSVAWTDYEKVGWMVVDLVSTKVDLSGFQPVEVMVAWSVGESVAGTVAEKAFSMVDELVYLLVLY